MIIAIAGKIGSGKTTLAKHLQKQLPHFEIKSFATPIYEIVDHLTYIQDVSYLKSHKDKDAFGIPIRCWLQGVGSSLRNAIHEDIWIWYLMNQYNPQSNWVIDDLRYENEAEALSDCNSMLIKLTGRGSENPHESEHGLEHWDRWDSIFDNNGDIQQLTDFAMQIAQQIQKPKDTREQLARYAHDAWSGWMEYMFDKSTFNVDGSVTIMSSLVDRWLRQSKTIYDNLPESEKESDRIEADKMIAIFEGKTFL